MKTDEIKEALIQSNRVDKSLLIKMADGKSHKVYTYDKFGYDRIQKKYARTKYARYEVISNRGTSYPKSTEFENYLELISNEEVVEVIAPVPHKITLEEMAQVYASTFDEEDYQPKLDDEDEMGRPLGTGSDTYGFETDEEDFYINGSLYVRAHGYYDPGDYWTPPESEYSIDEIEVTIDDAGYLDEDGNETPLTKEEKEELQGLMQKLIA